MSGNDQKLNPRITEVEIGIRDLRKITIYPFSTADQQKFEVIFSEILQKLLVKSKEADIEFVKAIIDAIKANIVFVLNMATGESNGEKLMAEMDNFQLTDVVHTIYDINYGQPGKNLKSLFGEDLKGIMGTILKGFISERLLPQSAKDMEDTDSKISTESPL